MDKEMEEELKRRGYLYYPDEMVKEGGAWVNEASQFEITSMSLEKSSDTVEKLKQNLDTMERFFETMKEKKQREEEVKNAWKYTIDEDKDLDLEVREALVMMKSKNIDANTMLVSYFKLVDIIDYYATKRSEVTYSDLRRFIPVMDSVTVNYPEYQKSSFSLHTIYGYYLMADVNLDKNEMMFEKRNIELIKE